MAARGILPGALDTDPTGTRLAHVVGTMIAAGDDREALAGDLERLALDARGTGDDEAEEIIFEVLDRLTGWCAPSAVL